MAERFDFQGPLRGARFSEATTPGFSPADGAVPPQSPAESRVQDPFYGPDGLHAGWRLLIFMGIVAAPICAIYLLRKAFGNEQAQQAQELTAGLTILGEGISFLLLWLATWVMTRIEGRTLGDYGLPGRKAFGKGFWQGALVGFVAMTGLLVALRVLGVFNFGSMALHGLGLVRYAALWGAAFVLVGFVEEFAVRGYVLFTLATSIGFWPSAILLSALFGYGHLGNHGEDWLGALTAGSAGFLFCLILRRTGDLWMAIGFHAAWDWAETFFYGVPDSGVVAPGHMLNPSFHGSNLLTGGTVGPEGSLLCLVVLVVCWVFFHLWLRQAKYPNPAAVGPRWHRA